MSSAFEMVKNSFRMPEAYTDWAEYRKAVTELILKGKSEEERSAVILGAGRCFDLDLSKLAEQYDSITLVDSDGEAIREAAEAFARTGSAGDGKVKVLETTLSGLTEADADQFLTSVMHYVSQWGRTLSEEEFIEASLKALGKLEGKVFTTAEQAAGGAPEAGIPCALSPESWDAVICLGLHSQLFALLSYAWNVLAANVSEQILGGGTVDGREIEDCLRTWNDRLIPALNEAIFGAARRRVIIGCEDHPEQPVEGAYQCLQDLERRTGAGAETALLRWPFDPSADRYYDMKIVTVRK